eukprot:SAG31_NODE_8426_length_1454_cov_4.301107_1_plen_97_part_00
MRTCRPQRLLALTALLALMLRSVAPASVIDVAPELRLVLCTPEIVRVIAAPPAPAGAPSAARAAAAKSPSQAVVNRWTAPVPVRAVTFSISWDFSC